MDIQQQFASRRCLLIEFLRVSSTASVYLDQVVAEDADAGLNGMVKYRMTGIRPESHGNPFKVDPHYGTLTVARTLEYAIPYTLFVEATDSPGNPSETRSSLAVVHIFVSNRNEHPPFIVGAPLEFWIGAEVPIGTIVGQIKASDPDGDVLEYDLLHKYREGGTCLSQILYHFKAQNDGNKRRN